MLNKNFKTIIPIVLVLIAGGVSTGYFIWQGSINKILPGFKVEHCFDENIAKNYDGVGCVEKYEQFDGINFSDAVCCEGLIEIKPDYVPSSCVPFEVETKGRDGLGEDCYFGAIHPLGLCMPCGDGVCEPLENRCNCPADCDK